MKGYLTHSDLADDRQVQLRAFLTSPSDQGEESSFDDTAVDFDSTRTTVTPLASWTCGTVSNFVLAGEVIVAESEFCMVACRCNEPFYLSKMERNHSESRHIE